MERIGCATDNCQEWASHWEKTYSESHEYCHGPHTIASEELQAFCSKHSVSSKAVRQ